MSDVTILRADRWVDVEAGEVRKVEVRLGTREASVVNDRDIPDICLQHMVAVMLVDKTVSFHAAHDVARMKDPTTMTARAKVELALARGKDIYDKRESIQRREMARDVQRELREARR